MREIGSYAPDVRRYEDPPLVTHGEASEVLEVPPTIDPRPLRDRRRIQMTGSAADRRLRCVRGDIERLNPVGLHQPPGYHHVTVVSAGPTAYLAGQCPLDANGSLLGPGDIDAQVDAVVRNALTALAAVDATAERVVRSVIYVASNETGVLGQVWRRLQASLLAPAFTSAATLIGVSTLGFTGQLVEIDLTAALTTGDEPRSA